MSIFIIMGVVKFVTTFLKTVYVPDRNYHIYIYIILYIYIIIIYIYNNYIYIAIYVLFNKNHDLYMHRASHKLICQPYKWCF